MTCKAGRLGVDSSLVAQCSEIANEYYATRLCGGVLDSVIRSNLAKSEIDAILKKGGEFREFSLYEFVDYSKFLGIE